MSDNARQLLVSHLSNWKTRPLIVEFKGALAVISGLFNISDLSESKLRLRFVVSMCATCELDVYLSTLRSFSVKTLQEAMNSVLKSAVEELVAEAGQPFEIAVVEQVAILDLEDGSTLLIGALKEEAAWPATSLQSEN